jgi:Cu/Ag efflux pump CusA
MLQPLAIAVIGGILISMILSLIITPAIQYYMTRDKVATETVAGTPVAVR